MYDAIISTTSWYLRVLLLLGVVVTGNTYLEPSVHALFFFGKPLGSIHCNHRLEGDKNLQFSSIHVILLMVSLLSPSTTAGTGGLRDKASGKDCVAQSFYVSGLLGWLMTILPLFFIHFCEPFPFSELFHATLV